MSSLSTAMLSRSTSRESTRVMKSPTRTSWEPAREGYDCRGGAGAGWMTCAARAVCSSAAHDCLDDNTALNVELEEDADSSLVGVAGELAAEHVFCGQQAGVHAGLRPIQVRHVQRMSQPSGG